MSLETRDVAQTKKDNKRLVMRSILKINSSAADFKKSKIWTNDLIQCVARAVWAQSLASPVRVLAGPTRQDFNFRGM